MGRSPVLATVMLIRLRPALISSSPAAVCTSPGIIEDSSWLLNGVVHGHELGAVRKGGLHLHFTDELRDAVHDVFSLEQGGAMAHQLGDGLAVTRAFQNGRGDVRHGLGVVEFYTAGLAALRQEASGEDQQFVLFSRA